MRGVLLLAHGSRSPEATAACVALARQVGEACGAAAEVGFLELSAPDVAEAGGRLAALGCDRVVVLPLLIAPGRHAAADVPTRIARLAEAHPAVRFLQAPAIGADPGFAALVAGAASRALEGR